MLKSKNLVVINSSNLQFISGNMEIKVSLDKKLNLIRDYKIVDTEGNLVYEAYDKYIYIDSNNTFVNVEDMENDIIFLLENGAINLLVDLLDNVACVKIRVKNYKRELENKKRNDYMDNIHNQNKIMKTELKDIIVDTNYLYTINSNYSINLYEKLDSKVTNDLLEYILKREDKNKYIKELEYINNTFTEYNTMNEILNNNLKIIVGILKNYIS